MSYARPLRLDEALAALARGPRLVLAGGTDVYPARVGATITEPVLDITGIAALRGVTDLGECWRIGALATWSDIARAALPSWFEGLKRAARAVGGAQIQNVATVLGNVCNASPAADGAPNLLAMDARVVLEGKSSSREPPIGEFLVGNRRTTLRADELATALILPKPRHPARSTFLKLGARRYLVISIAMVAATIEVADGLVTAARVAVGACSAVARRLPELEAALIGRPANPRLADVVRPDHFAALSPIDDIRGTAAYRLAAAAILTRRALAELGDGW